jgi:hypothetical protein
MGLKMVLFDVQLVLQSTIKLLSVRPCCVKARALARICRWEACLASNCHVDAAAGPNRRMQIAEQADVVIG